MPYRIESGLIKAVQEGEDFMIELLACPFGSEADKDYWGEWFSKRTEFMTKIGETRPVIYNHGISPDGQFEPDKAEIGTGKAWKLDQGGFWFKIKLDPASKFFKKVWAAATAGKLFGSTGVAGILKKKIKTTGELLLWAIGEITLVVAEKGWRPANWNAFARAPLKSLYESVEIDLPDEYAKSLERLKALEEQDDEKFTQEKKVMEKEKLLKLLKAMREAKLGDDEILKSLNDMGAELESLDDLDEEEAQEEIDLDLLVEKAVQKRMKTLKLNKAPGYFRISTPGSGGTDEEGPIEQYWHYIKTGDATPLKKTGHFRLAGDMKMDDRMKAVWEVGSGSGAAVIPQGFYGRIMEQLHEENILFKSGAEIIFENVQTLPIIYESTSMTKFVRTAEKGTYDEDEGAVTTTSLTQEKFTKQVKVTEETLHFSPLSLENYFTRRVADAYDETINYYIMVGTGTNQPAGIMSLSAALTFDGLADIEIAEVPELYHKMPQRYRDGAVWCFNGTTGGVLRGKTGNPFLFMPTPQGNKNELWTLESLEQNDIADIGASAKSIALANFTYYSMLMSPEIYVLRDDFTAKGDGHVNFWHHFYMDGSPILGDAFAVGVHPAA